MNTIQETKWDSLENIEKATEQALATIKTFSTSQKKEALAFIKRQIAAIDEAMVKLREHAKESGMDFEASPEITALHVSALKMQLEIDTLLLEDASRSSWEDLKRDLAYKWDHLGERRRKNALKRAQKVN